MINNTREKAAGATYATDNFSLEGKTAKLKNWKVSSALFALSTLKGSTIIVEENPSDLSGSTASIRRPGPT